MQKTCYRLNSPLVFINFESETGIEQKDALFENDDNLTTSG